MSQFKIITLHNNFQLCRWKLRMDRLPDNFLTNCTHEVAELMHLTPRLVSKWTAEYLISSTIMVAPRLSTHKPLSVRIEHGRALSMEHILECLEVISKRKTVGQTTDSTILHNHLLSSNRDTSRVRVQSTYCLPAMSLARPFSKQ